MRILKFLGVLLIVTSLTACQKNPANQINDQLQLIQTTNNQINNQLNTITNHEEGLQTAFENDLNQETISLETSELNTLLEKRRHEASQFNSLLDTFSENLETLDSIDLTNLEKGQSQLEVIKSNLKNIQAQFELIKGTLINQFDSESQLINVAISTEPSIQELQDALSAVNEHNTSYHQALLTLKSLGDTLSLSMTQWQTALDSETTSDEDQESDETPIDPPEEGDVFEPVIPQTKEAKFYIDEIFSVRAIDPMDQPLVLLTIDDAVQPEPNSYTLAIAKTLQAKGVSAIFFFNGMHLESDFGKEVLREVYEMGFGIGNHTHTHPNLSELNYEQTQSEIVKTNDLIESVIGIRPQFFRAPFGVMGEYGAQVVQEENMIWMNWSFGYDWEAQYMEKDALAEIMVNSPYLGDGSNLLMHDRKWTSEAMGDIVDGLLAKGYHIVDPNEIKVTGDDQ